MHRSKNVSLFNHLVSAGEQLGGDFTVLWRNCHKRF
jgi:hypothetical protein